MSLDESNRKSKTQEEPESESLDFDNPSYRFIPNEKHEWRQFGPYLRCMSCELEHGVYIGVDKLLVGFDGEGKPQIEKKIDY